MKPPLPGVCSFQKGKYFSVLVSALAAARSSVVLIALMSFSAAFAYWFLCSAMKSMLASQVAIALLISLSSSMIAALVWSDICTGVGIPGSGLCFGFILYRLLSCF